MIERERLDTVKKVAKRINLLTERGFMQTNVIEDVNDKVRQLNEQVGGFSFNTGDHQDAKDNKNKQRQQKLLVVKTSDPQSEQQINLILQKVAKINKNEVSIIKTQS